MSRAQAEALSGLEEAFIISKVNNGISISSLMTLPAGTAGTLRHPDITSGAHIPRFFMRNNIFTIVAIMSVQILFGKLPQWQSWVRMAIDSVHSMVDKSGEVFSSSLPSSPF